MCGMRSMWVMCCRCDVLYATRLRKVGDVYWRLEVVLNALEMLDGMRRVLLCVWRLWRGGSACWRCLEEMRCVLLCMLEVVEGELCLLEAIEAIRCMLEAVEGRNRRC